MMYEQDKDEDITGWVSEAAQFRQVDDSENNDDKSSELYSFAPPVKNHSDTLSLRQVELEVLSQRLQ